MINREEAIEIIKYASAFNSANSPLTKALDMAIEALKQTADKDCSRCIMRNSCLVKHEFKYMDYCQDWSEADD
jgi:hypothetical protein